MKEKISQIQRYRWENLKSTIQVAQTSIRSNASDQWVQADILCELLERLERFADEAVAWMHNPDNFSGLSETLLQHYPPNYGRYLITQQAINDFNLIWHIYNQRRGNLDGVQDATKIIYQLAEKALKPAIDANIIQKDIIIIPYLQKAPSIRIVPYANIAMIGLPYWLAKIRPDSFTFVQSLAQDFLAIPHEIGHFVYWHGERTKSYKDKHIQAGIARWLKRHIQDSYEKQGELEDNRLFKALVRWSEEIFADVYGVVAAEAESVQSLMNMLRDYHRPEKFFDIEDSHPAPAIRPYSALAALEVLEKRNSAQQGSRLSESQKSSWQLKEKWEAHDAVMQGKPFDTSRNKIYQLAGTATLQKRGNQAAKIKTSQGELSEMRLIMRHLGDYIVNDLLPQADNKLPMLDDNTQRIDIVKAKWVRESLDKANSARLNSLPFAIGWQEWLDNLYEEYELLDLSKYADNSQERYWVVAMNAGGWTEGPGTGGTSLQ